MSKFFPWVFMALCLWKYVILSFLVILFFSTFSGHNLCSSTITVTQYVLTLVVLSHPLKAPLKVCLFQVSSWLTLQNTYPESGHLSPLPLLPPRFKPPSSLPRTICKSLQPISLLLFLYIKIYSTHIKVILYHLSAQNLLLTPYLT